MIKIRLRRVGKTKRPFYRVVVARNEAKRDGAFLETLGSYDPHAVPPAVNLNEERAREWLAKGAQPSESAEKILRRAGVITAPAKPREQKPAAKAAAAPSTDVVEPVVAAAPAATPPAAAEEAEESAEADEQAVEEEEAK